MIAGTIRFDYSHFTDCLTETDEIPMPIKFGDSLGSEGGFGESLGSVGGVSDCLGSEGEVGDSLGSEGELSESLIPIPIPTRYRY